MKESTRANSPVSSFDFYLLFKHSYLAHFPSSTLKKKKCNRRKSKYDISISIQIDRHRCSYFHLKRCFLTITCVSHYCGKKDVQERFKFFFGRDQFSAVIDLPLQLAEQCINRVIAFQQYVPVKSYVKGREKGRQLLCEVQYHQCLFSPFEKAYFTEKQKLWLAN